eukprot:1959328-Alexandrium_andersonii.AAC.1
MAHTCLMPSMVYVPGATLWGEPAHDELPCWDPMPEHIEMMVRRALAIPPQSACTFRLHELFIAAQ